MKNIQYTYIIIIIIIIIITHAASLLSPIQEVAANIYSKYICQIKINMFCEGDGIAESISPI